MHETARRPGPDPLAVRCCACLAPPGEPCIGTTSDLPRERVHRLRPLAAAPRLVHCSDCKGSGWRSTGRVRWVASEVTCPVCGAPPDVMCSEGGTSREELHRVRLRAARSGLESCPSCEAIGWVPGEPGPEPTAPRPDVPDGMRPEDVPAELIEMAYQAYLRAPQIPINDVSIWGHALAAVVPEIERRAVEAERAAIAKNVRDYFAASDDPLYEDVRILCGRIERGEYGASR